MNQVLFEAEDNFRRVQFSEEETNKFKERFRTTMEWLNKIIQFSKPFVIIDLLSMFVTVLVIVLKQVDLKHLYFSNMCGISAFFLIMQISSLYISCKFLFKTIRSWIDRLHGIHETKGKNLENI